MPQLVPNPKGLDGFTRYHERGTNLPLFYRHEANVEVYVRFLDGDTAVSPLTILDAEGFAKLSAAPNYGLNLSEVRHQGDPVLTTNDDLAKVALGVGKTEAVSQSQAEKGWPWEKPTLVDGQSFIWPALIVGAALILSRILGRGKRAD